MIGDVKGEVRNFSGLRAARATLAERWDNQFLPNLLANDSSDRI
jgi:hypothetical protein